MTGAPRPIRAYVDTSVFGGCFDVEFEDHSRRFFDRVRCGDVLVLVSEVTERELSDAPQQVQDLALGLPPGTVEQCPIAPGVLELAEEYIKSGVVGPRWRDDATHVAAATTYRADLLVSWNFKHIVRWDRVRAFNAVNYRLGYAQLSICSPQEVQFGDAE